MNRSSGAGRSVCSRFFVLGCSIATVSALSVTCARVGSAQEAPEAQEAQDGEPAQAQVPGEGSYVVSPGDTLWGLSGRYFKSSYEWPRLWSYNPEITNPHWIYPGHVLRLREGAQGGYAMVVPTEDQLDETGRALLSAKSRYGSGFGAGVQDLKGAVLIGEEVYLDRDALDRSGMIVGSYEEHMMLSPSDEVYLKFGKKGMPPAGRELTVYRHITRKENAFIAAKPVQVMAGDRSGEIVRVLGAVRIKSVDQDTRIARAVIVEASEPIERGFEVADMPPRLATVQVRANAKHVEARIVAATRPLGIVGRNQLVFIDAGERQGVQPGNRFVVVRQGDRWRRSLKYLRETDTPAERPSPQKPDDSKYPEEIVGEVLVLYVRPESCTALIVGATEELEPGDRVEMPEGL